MPDRAAFTIERIRAGEPERMHDLLDLFATAFEDPENYNTDRPSREYLARILADPGFFALVALSANTVVGALTAYELRKYERERSEIYIYDLAVDAAYRRQGIATALIEALKPLAKARGAQVIFVQADHVDLPAVALYTKIGKREDVLHFDIPAA